MSEQQPVPPETRIREWEARKLRGIRSQGRDAAVLRGRLMGEQEAQRRNETGDLKQERVNRAMAYAAWEHDGKPAGAQHLQEFGIRHRPLAWDTPGGPDHKPDKKQR